MEHILILTVVKNASRWLPQYFDNISKLSYPAKYLSLAFLESDSTDGTYEMLETKLKELTGDFHRTKLIKKDFGYQMPKGLPRWSSQFQIQRRSILAKSRNHLLMGSLQDENWVLWLDIDVVEYPHDVIEQMLATGKEIIHPNCVHEYGGESFDLNAWKDKGRLHMHDLRGGDDLQEIDSVGGTMLMVKADCHRDGLVFPPYLYGKKQPRIRKHNTFGRRKDLLNPMKTIDAFKKREWQGEIETEGFAMMAHDMEIGVWAMPNLEIKHPRHSG